ncbi:DUF3139 domain-containing protein [Exiguobacterium sp. RIT341]|uniref:DUF3139 domain-containing protein n=1 Tax=Exiguobacterium sp. RIT341 TaxID=1470592 RepID=UPI0004504598|nr:DUF3139 domain-containing protein [Exiguobacterium sp. RIT341]EZP61331.1 hypothetical protein BW42_01002 [Exiguobacterium sp. RIT341]
MKKEVRPLVYTLVVLVMLIAAYPTYRLGSKVIMEIKIERLLAETGYDQDIYKKETVYDSKTGRYEMKITYTNELDHTYYYEIIEGNVLTTVYDQHNVEVTVPGQHELK